MSGYGDRGSTIDNLQLSTPTDITTHGHKRPATEVAVQVVDYIHAAISTNTRRAYATDLADFLEWGGSVPATPEVLAEYVASRAAYLSPNTLSRRLVGIGRAHRSLGVVDPTRSELVRVVLRGIKHVHGTRQRGVSPIRVENLHAASPRMVGQKGLRDRALLLVGFAGALRRSEIISLDVEDFVFSASGVVVLLRRSKTDQCGVGRRIAIPLGRTSLCAVTALRAWLDSAQIVSGAVFRSVSRSGAIGGRLSPQSVALIVKRNAPLMGLAAKELSGHSLRVGFVTSAAQAGVPLFLIQQQTGHASIGMLTKYIRDARLFSENPCSHFL